jgi:hypothetical protein
MDDMEFYRQGLKDERNKAIGELLAEELLRVLGKITAEDFGVIRWVEYELDTEIINCNERDPQGYGIMLNNIRTYLNNIFTKKVKASRNEEKEAQNG